jgi:hypothetical protein
MSIKRICAWCKSGLGIVDASPSDMDVISHGICPACYNTKFKQVDATGNMERQQ